MKLLFMLLLAFFIADQAMALPNPAAAYCEKLGYEYKTIQTPRGEKGVVIIKPGVQFDAWDFFRGKAGNEYSFGALHGYDTECVRTNIGTYVAEYAVCVPKGNNGPKSGARIPLQELMEQKGLPLFDETIGGKKRASSGANVPGDINEDMLGIYEVMARDKTLPAAFDWRTNSTHAYIGSIRDQGSCGSCYSFAAAAAAEGTYNWATGKYDANCADFSESYIIWCLGRLSQYNSHFYGCDGADYDYAELTAISTEGICNEADFPYTISDPGSCVHWSDPVTVFSSWHRVPCGDIDAIKTAIMTYGVVDAAVYVTGGFEPYSGGIFTDSNTNCDASPCYYKPTNHAIALVGWNDSDGGYWILRNSWNTTWGEDGYMRIRYNAARVACEVCYLTSKADQAITFPAIPDQTVTSRVVLAATAGSGLPVSFSVVSGPGAISSDILTFTGTGAVSVLAGQAGNALWNAAPNVINSVTVRDASTLAAPQNLAASDGTYTDKVALAWSAVSGAGCYQVWRAGENNVGAAVSLGTAILSSYDDNSSAVLSATMLYYWVKAFNSVATSEFSAVDSGFCRSTENPAIISGQPMVGDYDGDRKADPAVYNLANGRLFAWLSSAAYLLVTPVATFQVAAGDLPVVGDFDGDRLADPGVFQRLAGAWYIWLSSAGYTQVGPLPFGIDINDTPIPADYDGDGKADPAICNGGTEWYVWLSSSGYFRIGPLTIFRVAAGDLPTPGQFDADMLADPAVYQTFSGNWHVWLSSSGYFRIGPIPLRTTGDHVAVPSDYDGDGLADPAAYVPTNGIWRIWESSHGYALTELLLQ